MSDNAIERRRFIQQLALVSAAVGLSGRSVIGSILSYCNLMDVWVHLQDLGWRPASGSYAGTVGQSRRLEAIRIRANCRIIAYQCYVQNLGWLPVVADGAQAGTTGRSLRMEALRIRSNPGHVFYMVHLERIGWTGPYKDWEVAGTTGQSRRLEAVAIRLSDSGTLNLPEFGGSTSQVVTVNGDCEKRFWWSFGSWPSFHYYRHTTTVDGDVWIDDPFYQVFGPNTGGNPFELKGLSQPTAPVYDDASVRLEILRKTRAVSIWLTKYADHVHYRASTDGIPGIGGFSCDQGHLQFRIILKGRRR